MSVKVTVESNLDEKLLKEYGATLKNGSVEFTVSDLTESDCFDE